MKNSEEQTTTALTIAQKYLPPAIAAAIKNLDEKAADMAALNRAAAELNPMMLATAQAVVVDQLRAALTPEIVRYIRALANTPIGFSTDRVPGKRLNKRTGQMEEVTDYPDEVYKDFAIACYSAGARLYGNEANIIKGKLLLTKNFYFRLNDEALGKENWSARYAGIQPGDKGARVVGSLWWRDSSGEHREDRYIADVVGDRETSGIDMYVGKWEKRAARYIFEQSSGRRAPEDVETATLDAQNARAEAAEAEDGPITQEQARTLLHIAARSGKSAEALGAYISERFGKASNLDIRRSEYGEIIAAVNDWAKK